MIRAKRAGTWWNLARQERKMYELALRLGVEFRSHDLLRALVSVLKALRMSCDGAYLALMKGMRLAWGLSETAVSWGNSDAREWRHDLSFARYLASHLWSSGSDT